MKYLLFYIPYNICKHSLIRFWIDFIASVYELFDNPSYGKQVPLTQTRVIPVYRDNNMDAQWLWQCQSHWLKLNNTT